MVNYQTAQYIYSSPLSPHHSPLTTRFTRCSHYILPDSLPLDTYLVDDTPKAKAKRKEGERTSEEGGERREEGSCEEDRIN